MAERKILIRAAALGDLESIAHLYSDYMFDSYLLKFGNIFVKKYLEVIIKSGDCVTFVAVEDCITGFIMATFNSKKILFKIFFNIKILYIWAKQVLIRPNLFFESLGLFFYPLNAHFQNVNAEFLFIAIKSRYRKKNLATKLIKEVLNLMKLKGIKKVKVSTLVKNAAINILLEKLGFEVKKTFRLSKKHMLLYSYELH